MEILTQEKPLFEVDENRLNDLMQISRQLYPTVPEWFILGICNEQVMYEQGYEPDETVANDLYQKAQEELKTTEYYIKVERS